MTDIDGFVLGVDLGTSHTVAMLRHPDGRTRPLLFDGQPLMSSAVYLDTTGRLHAGADAVRLGNADPGRLEPHPKRRVDDGTVLLGEGAVPVADLLAVLLGAVAREAVATAGLLPPAILTYPAAWGAARRAVLTEALGKAGWPAGTRLVPEPVAAARYFADVLRRPVSSGASLAVFDFGGGTLDVAVVRNDGPGPGGRPQFSVTASGGADDLGGLDLDAALVDHLGKSLAGSEPEAWRRLTEPVTLAEWRARRQFWEDVRGAKEMLSRGSFAPVPVPGVEHAVQLTRDELEAAIDPLVRRGVGEAAAVLAAAGLRASELAGLFLVGGSSRVPMVARLLHAELGIAPTVLEQPELPVAEGAIIAAGAATPPRFAPGQGTAATPTPTPPTVPDSPPPITDTRADPAATPTPSPAPASAPSSPPSSGPSPRPGPTPISTAPAARRPDEPTDERLKSEPVDPWATGEAAALAAGGHGAPISLPPTPSSPPTPSPPSPVATSPPPFGTHQPSGGWAAAGSPAYPSSPAYPGGAVHQVSPGGAGHPVSPGGGGRPVSAGGTGHYAASPGPGQYASPAGPGHYAPAGPDHPGQPGGWAPGATTPKAARARHRLGKRSYILIAVALIIALGATATWYFWPGYGALDYQPLSEPKRIAPVVPVGSDWSDAEILDGRVYFASSDSASGNAGVVAMGLGDSKPAWRMTVAGGKDVRWKSMMALPVGVALFTETDSTSSTRQIVVLGAEKGKTLWSRTIGGTDVVLFAGGTAVIADRKQHQLIGVRLSDGSVRWTQPDPPSQYPEDTNVVAVTTPKDLDGPATVFGRPFEPDFTDDPRIVQIGADKSARVINADTGKILVTRQNVADPDDEVVAHNGRLIVLQPDDQRIVAYDLGKFGEPRVLYTTQQQHSQMKDVTPCGDDRVCFDEEVGYDGKSATVVALDVADGKQLWRYPLANTESIVPVGEALLVTTTTPDMTLLDPKGTKVWTHTGEAARLDAGNLLEFSQQLSRNAGETALYGRHLGDEAVPLGSFTDVRADTCAWDTSMLACVADKDFIIQRFAH
ncbi:Hsp70 family protein [Paractinoplanes globisporus]|uniref:Hsp70 family protein n=1 Tax=Paractinoplanes globisporus TaxID=113565 RepID=A0ABW6WTN1_9ACTN|nr:Hsp70 family protein [Actinoplanes globisporus]